MSVRSRRRRSELELLREARAILFPGGSDTEDETDHTDAVRIEPTQTDHTDAVRAEPEHRQTDHTDAVRIEPTQTDHTDAVRAEPEQRRTAHTDGQMDQIENLAALTQALQLAGRPSFKPPTFNGEEDVGLFLKQFGDVADANRWSPLERTLHLRSQLTGDAQSCGQGESYEEIVEDLQARYGLTRRMARDRLSAIQLKSGQNVHKQAAEINRLVRIAFPILPEMDQQGMALDYFSRAWESKAVQEHLLSVRPANIREAVRATEDFLAVHLAGPRPRAHVVEQTEEEVETTPAAEAGLMIMAEAIRTQTALLQQILMQLNTRQMPSAQAPAPQKDQQIRCYDCGGPHFKRNCPQRQTTQSQGQQPGNGVGPAQV